MSWTKLTDAARLPATWEDLPSWECPGGCGEILRSADGKPQYQGSVEGYARDVCCSACAGRMISKHMAREEILQRAGAPRRICQSEFDPRKVPNPGADSWPSDPRRPESRLETWAGEPETVVLTGPNGRGKSMLAGELLVRLFRRGLRSQAWMRPSQIVAEHFDGRDRYLRGLAAAVQVLVFDEFGRGQHSHELAHALVGEVIDRRVSDGKATIITTNLSVSDQGERSPSIERADSAVFDRLLTGLLIRMDGPSYRGIA